MYNSCVIVTPIKVASSHTIQTLDTNKGGKTPRVFTKDVGASHISKKIFFVHSYCISLVLELPCSGFFSSESETGEPMVRISDGNSSKVAHA